MEKDYLKSDYILEDKISIGDIKALYIRPREELGNNPPSLILYHGWSSSKEAQRMRGIILASMGFQVFIPDAIHHGERGRLEQYNLKNASKYFWETVLSNIEESDKIIDTILSSYGGTKDRIGLIGHSMGGFTSGGVFVRHRDLNSLVVLNGSCNWARSNEIFMDSLFKYRKEELEVLEEELGAYDPAKNLDSLGNRPILMLHGKADSLVSIEAQEDFYRLIKDNYRDGRLKYIRYDNLNHFVTTNMMEESIVWFRKHMGLI